MKYLLAIMLLASMPAMAYDWETRFQQEQRARDYSRQLEAQDRRIRQMEQRLEAQERQQDMSNIYEPVYPSVGGNRSVRTDYLYDRY